MAVKVETNAVSAQGKALASAGTPFERKVGQGNDTVTGQYDADTARSCTGDLVADPETGVVSFVPDDPAEFEAVVEADEP
jgi:hypothetical protein